MKRYARGERNGRAKLDWEKVKLIRHKRETGCSTIWLSIEHGVAQSTISAIVTGKTWNVRKT